jgi:lysophospholipase L1-like esterase
MTLPASVASEITRRSHFKIEVPKKVVALGDSLVYGYGDPEQGGWVEQLRRTWMRDPQGPVLYNLGIRGDTVIQVRQRLAQEFRQRGEIRHQVPDALLLAFGVNDSARLGHLNGRHLTPFADFQLQLAEVLDQAQNLGQVFFIGMVPVDEVKMPFMQSFFFNHADQHLYKEATRLACQERGIPYCDVFEILRQQCPEWIGQGLSPDGLHPNSWGYQRIFDTINHWEPLQSWISAPLAVI